MLRIQKLVPIAIEDKNKSQRQRPAFEHLIKDISGRTDLLAHSFSNSNINCKKAIEYFEIKNDNYVQVAKDIFIKSIYTMNTLERELLVDNSDE